MSYSAIANTGAQGLNGTSTGSIDTTGATLIVLALTWYNGSTISSFTDSKSNTLTPLTEIDSGPGDYSTRLYYAANPTVGSNHSWTVSGTGIYFGLAVAAFSGVATSPYDGVQNGSTTFSQPSTYQPGSITPSQDGCLIITFAGWSSGTDYTNKPTVGGGFTIAHERALTNGAGNGISLAWLEQSTAAAINPTWTWSGLSPIPVAIQEGVAAFRSASGGITWKPWLYTAKNRRARSSLYKR